MTCEKPNSRATPNNQRDRVTFRTDRSDELDQLVERGVYPNRSEAIRAGLDRVLEENRAMTDGGSDDRY